MELKNLTKGKIHHLLGLLEDNEREGLYYGNKAQYWNRHRELKEELKLLLSSGSSELRPVRYKCLLCGRDKFTRKTSHYCVGGYRKHNIEWQPIYK